MEKVIFWIGALVLDSWYGRSGPLYLFVASSVWEKALESIRNKPGKGFMAFSSFSPRIHPSITGPFRAGARVSFVPYRA